MRPRLFLQALGSRMAAGLGQPPPPPPTNKTTRHARLNEVRFPKDELVSPVVCAEANRHGDAKDSPFVACEHCGTFRWNGVDMCGKLIRSAVLGPSGQKVAHACTRALGHDGPCNPHVLPRDRKESYTPS